MTRGIDLVADLQRIHAEDVLTEGAPVAPSVIYLSDSGYVGSLTLSPDAQCTLAAVALPMRICPEIRLASLALDGALVNLSAGPKATDAFTVLQFHRDRSWVIEIAPYIRSEDSLVWDTQPKVFDDLSAPDPIRDLADHLYIHIDRDTTIVEYDLKGLDDRFAVAGAILLEVGDATQVWTEIEGGKT